MCKEAIYILSFQDYDGEKLLQQGARLMEQSRSMNRVWTKDGGPNSHKKRKFQKPDGNF
jgi:hypothetical protein